MNFLVYLTSVSDNIHLISSLLAFICGVLTVALSTVPVSVDKKLVKQVFLGFVIFLTLFIITPNNWKHSMDMQYIKKAGQLELENIQLKNQLMQLKLEEDF